MGEISKNFVFILAIAVIIISALGTWTVLNAAMQTLGGSNIASVSENNGNGQTGSDGVVLVNVIDDQGNPPISTSEPLSGRVIVNVLE